MIVYGGIKIVAKRGRPSNTEDMYSLVNRMLKKRDVKTGGKTVTRRDALVELLWRLVFNSQGKNTAALRFLLEYSGGKAVTSDKLPKNNEIKENEDISFLERENFLDKLIAERKAAKESEKTEPGSKTGESSK